ncbi:MAG TPA: ParB/RepB/Spo0J family partition protein, partial [Ktedonosporobacter sp.]|nr:ParB/RepB/Spo0J family partition protein [Ktedonosporobacter sp.]
MGRCQICERQTNPMYIVRLRYNPKDFLLCYICLAERIDIVSCSQVEKEGGELSAEEQPKRLAINLLQDNPYQPRASMEDESLQQLAETMKSQGFQGVLVARPHPHQAGAYQLTAGHRRREAARLAGLTELPVMLHELSELEMATLAATENIQREDLSPLEEGRLFQVMRDVLGQQITEIANAIKKDRGYIRNRLRLASAPEDIQAFIVNKADSLSTVTYLLEIEDPAERAPIIEQLSQKILTVVDLPEYIEEMKRHKLMDVSPAVERPAQSPMAEAPMQSSAAVLSEPSPAMEPATEPPVMESLTLSAAREQLVRMLQLRVEDLSGSSASRPINRRGPTLEAGTSGLIFPNTALEGEPIVHPEVSTSLSSVALPA